jgi:hypothetical protein
MFAFSTPSKCGPPGVQRVFKNKKATGASCSRWPLGLWMQPENYLHRQIVTPPSTGTSCNGGTEDNWIALSSVVFDEPWLADPFPSRCTPQIEQVSSFVMGQSHPCTITPQTGHRRRSDAKGIRTTHSKL